MNILNKLWAKYEPILGHYKIWMIVSGVLLAIILFS
jgi:hypothetical protein